MAPIARPLGWIPKQRMPARQHVTQTVCFQSYLGLPDPEELASR